MVRGDVQREIHSLPFVSSGSWGSWAANPLAIAIFKRKKVLTKAEKDSYWADCWHGSRKNYLRTYYRKERNKRIARIEKAIKKEIAANPSVAQINERLCGRGNPENFLLTHSLFLASNLKSDHLPDGPLRSMATVTEVALLKLIMHTERTRTALMVGSSQQSQIAPAMKEMFTIFGLQERKERLEFSAEVDFATHRSYLESRGGAEMFAEESGDEIERGNDSGEFVDPGAAEGRDETASRAPAEEEKDEEEEPEIRRSRRPPAAAGAESSDSDDSSADLSVSSAAQAELDRAHEERKSKAAERRHQRGKCFFYSRSSHRRRIIEEHDRADLMRQTGSSGAGALAPGTASL